MTTKRLTELGWKVRALQLPAGTWIFRVTSYAPDEGWAALTVAGGEGTPWDGHIVRVEVPPHDLSDGKRVLAAAARVSAGEGFISAEIVNTQFGPQVDVASVRSAHTTADVLARRTA